MAGWDSIFGGQEDMNRAERRKADQEWARLLRRQRRAQARKRRNGDKKED